MRVPQVSERIKEAPAQALRGVFAGIGQLLLITDKLRNKTPADQDVPRARTPEAPAKATVTSPAGQRGQTATAPAEPAPAEPTPGKPAAAEPVTSAPAPAEAAAADAAVAAEPAAEIDTAKPATARRTPAKPATAKPTTAKSAAKPATARRAAAKPTPAGPAGAEPPKPPKRQSPRDFDKTGNVRLLGDEEGSSALSATAPVSPAAPASTADPITAPEAVTAAEPVSSAEPVSESADSEAPLPNYDELSVASLRARLRNLDVAQVGRLADYERAHAARAEVLAMFERRIAKLEAEA
jgi:hypothetical protein